MSPSPSPLACLISQGDDYLVKQDFAQALDMFENALILAQQNQNPDAEVLALQRLGALHLEQGQITLAIASLGQALAIAQEHHNLPKLYDCHRQFAQIHKAGHNFEAALKHLETSESIRDAIPPVLPSPDNITPTPAGPGASSVPPLDESISAYQALEIPMLFRNIVEQANIGVAIFQEGCIVYSNHCFQQWLGYLPSETDPLRLETLLSTTDYNELLDCHWQQILQKDDFCRCEKHLHCRNGIVLDVEFNASVIEFHHRPAILTYMHNITEQKKIESHLKASEERYRSLFDHVPMGLCRFSPEGRLLDANPAMVSMFGFADRDAFLAANPLLSTSQDQEPWEDYLNRGGLLKYCELHLTRRDGHDLWVRISARAVTDADARVSYYEGAVEDITEIKAAQIALEELAIRDSLTHVYNRRHFFELAQRELARSRRFNRPVTLLMADIDHFKSINDTYGHLVGDRVLRDVVLRLKENLRQSDILARYGGEEFIVLMPETNQDQAWNGAERLRKVIANGNFQAADGSIPVTISVGVTSWQADLPTPPPNLENLIDQADQALYQAKQRGRNRTEASRLRPFSGLLPQPSPTPPGFHRQG